MEAHIQQRQFIHEKRSVPRHTLSTFDAVAIIVGIVIGAGIFKTPSLVAAKAGSEYAVLLAWLFGGLISFIGALCYAELASTYPHTGGDYHYITRAFGRAPAFLFAWARMVVIQTGSIAMMAFIIGDYASEVASFGRYSSPMYAAVVTVILTAINVAGIKQGKWVQNILTLAIIFGLLSMIAAGLSLSSDATAPPQQGAHAVAPAFGSAMIFVLLTYGGWNEAAYISAEMRNTRRNIVHALLLGIVVVTCIYVAVNATFMKGLGVGATAGSDAVAADLMRRALGEGGAKFISLLVVIAALSTINGAMITGARTNYTLGRDFSLFNFLGQWNVLSKTPVNALIAQGGIALGLIALGAATRSGFSTMVEYTAPVFWFFLLLVGISFFILRRKDQKILRPFKVPLYPLTPILFCLFCLYMLQSSIAYTGIGALVGIGMLFIGIPVFFFARSWRVKTT